jgi:vacuolar-type H+-ATPase subunit F/Vma7
LPSSIIIITHPDFAIGYQLAGVAVLEATNGTEAFNHLRNAIKDEDIGLIGVDEELYESVNPRFLAAIKKRGKPLILSMQSVKDGSISVDDYIRKLTLSTAGVIVKVEKEN